MKSISKMTIKELKAYIKENTISVNKALESYYESGEDISTVNKQISKLKQLSGISKKDNRYIIANFRGKKKVELVRQARELTYFSNWDIDTPLGIEQASERERKAYEEFSSKKEFKNIEYDEWRGLVEAFGALGDKLNSYGYEHGNIAHLYSNIPKDERKVDIFKAMQDSVDNSPSLTVDQRLIDIDKRVRGLTDKDKDKDNV